VAARCNSPGHAHSALGLTCTGSDGVHLESGLRAPASVFSLNHREIFDINSKWRTASKHYERGWDRVRARDRGRARMPHRCGCYRMYVGAIPRACFAGRNSRNAGVACWVCPWVPDVKCLNSTGEFVVDLCCRTPLTLMGTHQHYRVLIHHVVDVRVWCYLAALSSALPCASMAGFRERADREERGGCITCTLSLSRYFDAPDPAGVWFFWGWQPPLRPSGITSQTIFPVLTASSPLMASSPLI